MGRADIPCARCGRHAPADELFLWLQDERYRVFRGPPAQRRALTFVGGDPAESEAGPEEDGVYAYVRRPRAYLTCTDCFERLQNGGRLTDVHNRKVALWFVGVVAFAAVVVVGAPVALPALLAAFWWW